MLCRGLGDYFSAGVAGRTYAVPIAVAEAYLTPTVTRLMHRRLQHKQFRSWYDHEIDAVSQATRQIADCEVSGSSRAIESQRKLNQVVNGKLKPIWTSLVMNPVFGQLLDDSTGYLREHAWNVGDLMPPSPTGKRMARCINASPNVCG